MTERAARAIRPLSAPLDATVELPGSKSITNRALITAALANGHSTLTGVLFADDTEAMIEGLSALNVAIDVDRDAATVAIDGTGGMLPAREATIDARQSGTSARFLAPVLALGTGTYRLDGSAQLRARPMRDLLSALGDLGVTVDDLGAPGHLPVAVHGAYPWAGGHAVLAASTSSQFASGLMLAAPVTTGGITLDLDGDLVSEPYLELTAAVMRAFSASPTRSGRRIGVPPTGYRATHYAVEPDASAGSYFLAAAAITHGRVRIGEIGDPPLQGDWAFADVLGAMGATVEQGPGTVTVLGTTPLHGIDVDLRHLSDCAPTLAVVAAFAASPTRVRGIGFIRDKESDRIGAVVTELRRLGVDAEEEDDGFTVRPGEGTPRAGRVETYDDHRMAMAFAIAGLRVPGIEIADPGCVAKTFPGFWDALDRLEAGRSGRVTRVASSMRVIAIDGPAGAGKSTVAKALAERLGLDYLDTGAMYRAVAFAALYRNLDPEDPSDAAAIARLAEEMDLEVSEAGVIVDGTDATIEIRGPEVTRAVGPVASNTAVRTELRRRQREWAEAHGGGVIEGRDIGTVVFPQADLKVYVTADVDVRARRRAKEVTDLDYEQVVAAIIERDARDHAREDGGLATASDATVIDSTDRSVDEMVESIMKLLA